MAVAKTQKKNPRQLAQEVSARLSRDEIPATWEIAGPGFINFRLDLTGSATPFSRPRLMPG